MSVPFTPMRVCRYLALCLLAMLAAFAIFELLTEVRPHQTVVPGKVQSQIAPTGKPQA